MQTSLEVKRVLLAAFVLGLDHHHFVDIQQVVKCIRPVPQLVLLPDSGNNRGKEERVIIRRFSYDPVYFLNRLEIELFSSKKSAAPHLIASKQSIIVRIGSYSTPSTP